MVTPEVDGREGSHIWRSVTFRNLGAELSSELIREATDTTYRCWMHRYGELPEERLRKPHAGLAQSISLGRSRRWRYPAIDLAANGARRSSARATALDPRPFLAVP